MSDSPSPSLPSTADAVPYVPVSWAAAAAATVAAVFIATLLALGYFAFVNKKPLLMEGLLVMPAVALVLCFAARRVVRNSEGTRTELLYGVNLINTAWWASVVAGLCYVAYLFAVDFAIRSDARGEVERWMGLVAKAGEGEPHAAFMRTVPPGQRLPATDTYGINQRYGNTELLSFRNSDLVKLAGRNKGELRFTPGAVNWAMRAGTVEGVLLGTVTCPEGTFPIAVPFKGIEGVVGGEGGGAGRQWMIAWQPGTGFLDPSRASRTEYGWLLAALEADGASFGKAFVTQTAAGPAGHLLLYRGFVAPGGDLRWGAMTLESPIVQLAFAAPARVALGDQGYAEYMASGFYKREGGAEPGADYKTRFFNSFNAQGLRPAGDKLKDPNGVPIDKEDLIAVTETAVEVRVPVEIPVIGTGKLEAARGRLLVSCADPALLAEVKRLKAAANPAAGLATMPDTLDAVRKKAAWRVVRVESDMVPISSGPPASSRGGPPG